MSNEKALGGIDYFKITAAFLVVAIHTSPLSSFSSNGDFLLTRIIARIAVPFFLMVTGYFVIRPYLFHQSVDSTPLFRFIKKTLFLYIAAIILYLPINLYAGHFNGMNILDILRMLVFDGTLYHLWYLPASMLGTLLVFFASRRLSLKLILCGSLLLYIIGLFGDSYFGLIKNFQIFGAAYEALFQISSYTRNGIFYVPIFLVIGAWIGNSQKSISHKSNMLGLLLSFILMVAEGFTLHDLEIQRHDSMYLSLLPCMFFLFQLITSVKLKSQKSLRTVAAMIYVLHPLFIVVIRVIAKFLHIESILIGNSLVHYFMVCVFSWLAAIVIAKVISIKKEQTYVKGRAWIEIDRECLMQNVKELRKQMPPNCKLMPVLKANAYGHGAVLMARELNAMKIYSFCVATVLEGVELRRHHIKGEILILGYTHPQQFSLLRRYKLTQTVIDLAYAHKLNSYGKKIKVHLKIDTGMHRLGERSVNINSLCSMFQCKNLVINGVYTHLCACSTTTFQDIAFTQAQEKAFLDALAALKKRGFTCPTMHLQASYGLLNYPAIRGDYARIGIALYGTLSKRVDAENNAIKLHPILSVKARVVLVKDLFAGETAGYDLTYKAQRNMKIAILSIGYADGIPRSLSCGNGNVLINGDEAPIIGRICMDQMMVDVSNITSPQSGDVTVIVGKSGAAEITVYDIAERTETITNEVLSRLGNRLYRILV